MYKETPLNVEDVYYEDTAGDEDIAGEEISKIEEIKNDMRDFYDGLSERSRAGFLVASAFLLISAPQTLACGAPEVTIPEGCLQMARPEERRAMRKYISNFLGHGYPPEMVQKGVYEACMEIERRELGGPAQD